MTEIRTTRKGLTLSVFCLLPGASFAEAGVAFLDFCSDVEAETRRKRVEMTTYGYGLLLLNFGFRGRLFLARLVLLAFGHANI